MTSLHFIGSEAHSLNGNGKASAEFWRHALPVFKAYGIHTAIYANESAFWAEGCHGSNDVFVLIYNEDESAEAFDHAEALEGKIKTQDPNALVINSHKVGRILGDKMLSSLFFSSRGILMPRVIQDETFDKDVVVFSNLNRGSGRETTVAPSATVRKGGNFFNTEYINTSYDFEGKSFFVSLRSMCVGKLCVSTYVRCRPTTDGSASVHTSNTPLNIKLLNFLYANIVMPRQGKILRLCSQIGEALGPGFYSHDILPCASTGEVYLCESGFKFDEDTFARRFESLEKHLYINIPFNGKESELMAHAFVNQMRQLGRFT